jgi:hypothetical protein
MRSLRAWLSGRASPCQGEGRQFESGRPLEAKVQVRGLFGLAIVSTNLLGSSLWPHFGHITNGSQVSPLLDLLLQRGGLMAVFRHERALSREMTIFEAATVMTRSTVVPGSTLVFRTRVLEPRPPVSTR